MNSGGAAARAAAISVAILMGACTGRNRPTFIVRDSAGIRIFESRAPAWHPGSGWRLTKTPTLSIGIAQGDPHYELADVTGAVQLDDGHIVVADDGSKELRFYDAGGRFLSAPGRSGDGPGEFRDMRDLTVSRDSLLVYDNALARISVFDSAGDFARVISLPGFVEGALIGDFADGSLLVRRLSTADAANGSTRPGVHTWHTPYFRLSRSGQVLDSLGLLPFHQDQFSRRPDGAYDSGPYYFGRDAAAVARGGTFYFGPAATWRIDAYSESGVLQAVFRRPVSPAPVTSQTVDSLIDFIARKVSDANTRRAIAKGVRGSHADVRPAYSAFFQVDALGDLWVGDFAWRRQPPARWTIFAPDGRLLGDLDVPANFTLRQVGADFVLGVRPDSLGVQHVELFGLVKP